MQSMLGFLILMVLVLLIYWVPIWSGLYRTFLLGVRLYGRNSAAGASDCTTTGGDTRLAIQLRLGLLS